jgi:hypothetical protein
LTATIRYPSRSFGLSLSLFKVLEQYLNLKIRDYSSKGSKAKSGQFCFILRATEDCKDIFE